jgi:hypothetical protein
MHLYQKDIHITGFKPVHSTAVREARNISDISLMDSRECATDENPRSTDQLYEGSY